jgi:hypothetical protein
MSRRESPKLLGRVSAESNSQSIKIFADVEELLSPSTGRNAIPKAPQSAFSSRLPAKPDAMYSGKAERNLYLEPQDPPSQISRGKNTDEDWRTTENLVYSFPEPPRQTLSCPRRLLSFKKLFPESRYMADQSQEYPVANIDKMLPQPPYHVFESRTKKLLVYLLSASGLLSPLSTAIYFPALIAVMKVCNWPMPRRMS